MSEKEKKIMKTFEKTVPKMSESEKTYLLGFGEGLAAAVGARKAAEEEESEED